jgi:Protein of unknown function (DUF2798)
MLRIPRRYSHFLFAVIQSALTTAIAAAIASANLLSQGLFLSHWLQSWFLAWVLMLPVVIFFAPVIRKFAVILTQPDPSGAEGAASEG